MQVDWWLQPKKLCSATPSVASSGICHRNKKSTQLHDSTEGPVEDSILYYGTTKELFLKSFQIFCLPGIRRTRGARLGSDENAEQLSCGQTGKSKESMKLIFVWIFKTPVYLNFYELIYLKYFKNIWIVSGQEVEHEGRCDGQRWWRSRWTRIRSLAIDIQWLINSK